jgi:predicted CXXCH cytochrome family protein
MKGENVPTILIFICVVALASISLVGCAPEKQYKVLSFFFDGVPVHDTTIVVQNNTAASEDGDMVVNHNISKPEYFTHKPYEEEKCNSCHESDFSNRLIKKTPELCYNCHDDFSSQFKSLHGPVNGGYCTECHNQHMSKYEKLLDRTGQDLCLSCHQKEQILKSNKHEKIGSRNCTECHNPHGGDNSGMLKAGACNECHANFKNQFSILHGPVESGSCTMCHGSHTLKTKNILVDNGQQLCLNCHAKEQVMSVVAHKNINKTNCTECHNPHGEKNHYFLKPSLKQGRINLQDSVSKFVMNKVPVNRNSQKKGKNKLSDEEK